MTTPIDLSGTADLERFLEEEEAFRIDEQLGEILSDALSALRQSFEMDVGFIGQFSAGRRVIRAVDSSQQEPVLKVGDSHPLEDTYCQRILDGRLPNLIDDASTFPGTRELPITGALSIRAYAGAPVCFSDGEVYGTFCCFSTEEGKDFDEKDLAMLLLFAEFTGKQIERAQRKHEATHHLAHQVRSIIDNGLMHPVYQPIFEISEKRIIGYEALTRFDVEPYKAPDIWFAAADAVGLQTELEVVAVDAALKQLDQVPGDCYVSVNVSPETLSHPSFFDHLGRYPLNRLLIEVTEHEFVSDYERFNDRLGQHRAGGIKLAIDDVGAGYSSLRHILELKPEFIKLDRSLIAEIDKRFDLRSMAKALIKFAGDMGIKVVAEGIETIGELDMLGELGVITAQGYLLGRPVPIEQLQRN